MNLSKKTARNGFTLAELLIVIAIIAVLVAIAIPIMIKNLERSREAHDIYTMRQAASAAIELYYAGVTDSDSAAASGLSWSGQGSSDAAHNAYGAYDPASGKFYPSRDKLPARSKAYGKGTTIDGGTKFVLGNDRGAYAPDQDYTHAVVMIAIYPSASPARVDVYWKNNVGSTTYVGGQQVTNVPKYSISVPID